jgi:ABC-2 type transport system permease protein
MRVHGNGLDLFGLILLAVIVNVVGTLWAAGVALRLRSQQAGPVMQLPIFLIIFLAPVFVPLDLLRGWVHAVASVNPFTALLDAARSLLAGSTDGVALAFAIVAPLAALFVLWALRGLRAAERSA